ncbi:MAG: Raf kinase inhibitor-like YbhB/YbcL family protein [Lentimonas sp.]|jgi:Raf kinase inhibitor-like YbhB/YbcL family protein
MKKLLPAFLFCLLFSVSANAKILVSSPDFRPNQTIPHKNIFNGFGCEGGNISPEINIKDVPQGAKSLALTIYDPDAPTGSGWWHLITYNIPVNTIKIKAGELNKTDKFSFGKNDYGNFGYGGPCPPLRHGSHRYIVTIFALDKKLELSENSSAALIGFNINSSTIDKYSFTSIYQR